MSRAKTFIPRSFLAVSLSAGSALFAWPAFGQAADPPAPAAPEKAPVWTSTAGTDLLPPATAAAPNAAGLAQGARDTALEAAQNERIAALEERIRAMRFESRLPRETMAQLAWLRRFRLTGFVQPQLVFQFFNSAASPNATNGVIPEGIGANTVIARSDGSTTNASFFRLRRARLKTEFAPSDSARFTFEFDLAGGLNPQLTTMVKTTEAVGIVRWSKDATTEFAAGVFKPPFGYELVQSSAERPFIERSWGEQNMFPGDYDTGARALTRLFEKRFTAHVAIVNGRTQNEKAFALLPDLNKGKDFVGRVAYDLGILELGVSGYFGDGQVVDTTALRFKQFRRWAVGGELRVHHRFAPRIGETRFFGELVRARNMDRGVNYAFAAPSVPEALEAEVANRDQFSWWLRLEQDLGRYFALGIRYDSYSPDTALSDNRRETLGAVGIVHFTRGLELRMEYAHATDTVHREGDPAPSKRIDSVSTVLQARF